MSSTRPRAARRLAASASSTSLASQSSRPRRGAAPISQEPSPEPAPLASEEIAGPSRSRGAKRGKVKRELTEEAATPEDVDMDPEPPTRTRGRKSVSYREIPPEDIVEDEDDEEEEEDAEGEEDVEAEPSPPADATATPSRKRTSSQQKADESPFKREKVGSGRGGFSVKGAAAAAARARWAKVRREKAERGEDSDDGEKRARNRTGRRDQRNITMDNYAMGSQVTIKGQEYTVGDDELMIPDDTKGDLKIDAEGHLLGGREYKLVTFTSETRKNPNRVYALTIDAARACGYSDSLAFLRRCPQVLKLTCNNAEREMLIEIGRVTGNLKHRMVTMVAMRNIYKLMGARVVKNGKWVTDDYYEDESLTKCAEQGFTPYAPATEEDIIANAVSLMQPQGRPPAIADVATRGNTSLSPWYTLGGPTTHFTGNGADPWSDAGYGHKRSRLRNAGVTEEDWMLRIAEESRLIDARLKEYREERLLPLEGKDTGVWVYAVQRKTEEEPNTARFEDIDPSLLESRLKPPMMERKRSALSQEVTFMAKEEVQTPAVIHEDDEDASMVESPKEVVPAEKTEGGKIVVQTVEETSKDNARWNWTEDGWQAGTVYAAYEPHTHMPHVPRHTQPTASTLAKISAFPVVSSQADGEYKNFVQSTLQGAKAKGFASFEYVYAPPAKISRRDRFDEMLGNDYHQRAREVEEALEWERRSRARKAATSAVIV